jgi:nitronate monooxygenase
MHKRLHRALPEAIAARLALPLIAAPMLRVSGPDLVVAACRAGVIGAFPTANTRSVEELDAWLAQMKTRLGETERFAPICPNLIVRQPRFAEDLACLVRHQVQIVITSVGSPAAAVQPLHDVGCLVFADIASIRHAQRAIEVGVDGLILLSGGSGGSTGWANPFAFVRAVRDIFDGPIALAGGISDGAALWAAQALGCDLAYMGTKFIATTESMAPPAYREMLVESTMDDVMLTRAFTGFDGSMLRPSIIAAGLNPDALDEKVSVDQARQRFGGSSGNVGPKRWADVWSAGHSVSGVRQISDVATMLRLIAEEYEAARERSCTALRDGGMFANLSPRG